MHRDGSWSAGSLDSGRSRAWPALLDADSVRRGMTSTVRWSTSRRTQGRSRTLDEPAAQGKAVDGPTRSSPCSATEISTSASGSAARLAVGDLKHEFWQALRLPSAFLQRAGKAEGRLRGRQRGRAAGRQAGNSAAQEAYDTSSGIDLSRYATMVLAISFVICPLQKVSTCDPSRLTHVARSDCLEGTMRLAVAICGLMLLIGGAHVPGRGRAQLSL